jgi:Ca2+-binding EF-hand superfamily protein
VAFGLYDRDGDGALTFNEIKLYFTSFFTVCFDLSSSLQEQVSNLSPVILGEATAQNCFDFVSKLRNKKITFPEFQQWYMKQGQQQNYSQQNKQK